MEMAVTKLQRNENKKFVCPKCGRELGFIEGGAVSVVAGKVDMSSVLPKYPCESCGIYYQELLNSGYYDEFPLPEKMKPKKLVRTGDIPPMELKRDAPARGAASAWTLWKGSPCAS